MIYDLKDRTKRFAVGAVRFYSTLKGKSEVCVISNQLVRAGTSVGANYRAACRSKSKADFINQLSIVEEEADESEYGFELLESLALPKTLGLLRLKNEAHQLVAIMTQSKKAAHTFMGPVRTASSQFAVRNS
jgi:four helix bundle protein